MSRLFQTKDEERRSLWDRMVDVALTDVSVLVRGLDEGSLEALEETLIAADFGVPATLRLVGAVETLAERGVARSQADFRRAVREEIEAILRAGRADTALRFDYDGGPTVFLVVGVNGVGKTTTIAKLAHRLVGQGRSVMIAAGDTFRAGAIEQLRRWAERVGCAFVGSEAGRDPAAVAFDALEAATAQGVDVLIIDTAGRLHTQQDLMLELEKVQRVISRKLEGAPHETLIGTLPLTGIVLTKMDGTSKGGIVVALKEEFDLPVKFIGTGETMDALVPFEPGAFAEQVLAS
jgi:fused signal recognition particle receptor